MARRADRDSRPARPCPARPAAAILADSSSISRFRHLLPANPWRGRIGPSSPSIRAPDGPGGSPPSGKLAEAPRRQPQEFKRSPARIARNILPSSSRHLDRDGPVLPRAVGFRRFKSSNRSLGESVRSDPDAIAEVRGRQSRASSTIQHEIIARRMRPLPNPDPI